MRKCYSFKRQKRITITNAFKKILDESNCKLNKISVNKSREFYNRSTKSWLGKNAIEVCSTHMKKNQLLLKDLLLEP